jgi:homocysteine S-methyltransferase
VARFEWKVDAGAAFAVTRPVYDPAALAEFLKRIEHCRIPVLLALRPLHSYQQAEYLANEVPGVRVPAAALERLREASERGPEAARAAGIELAKETLAQLRPLVQGVVLASPSSGPALPELLAAIGATGR